MSVLHGNKFLVGVVLPLMLAVFGVAALAVELALFDSAVATDPQHSRLSGDRNRDG